MWNEYNIVKLNPRKNPYSSQLNGKCWSVLDEITCRIKEAIEYEKGNLNEESKTDNNDE